MSEAFSKALLAWFDRQGRHDLPWQAVNAPPGTDAEGIAYRIWLSEIMLQQTQVATVIPYFERFIARFPGVASLAQSPLDDVLHLWSGLGYYARARNLHRAARILEDELGGRFPRHLDAMIALPGIGRSTAAAILAQAFGQRHAILDGNVKRVLTRFHAIDQWPGTRAVETRLWALADACTPARRVAEYTQAIMDLGATLCTRSRPDCGNCPVANGCTAREQGKPTAYPVRKPAKTKPVKRTHMLLLQRASGEVLLEQRPPTGIWGGLWGLPEIDDTDDLHHTCAQRFGLSVNAARAWPGLRHTFSHFHLDIVPLQVSVASVDSGIMERGNLVWYNPATPDARGLAAPVSRLLAELMSQSHASQSTLFGDNP